METALVVSSVLLWLVVLLNLLLTLALVRRVTRGTSSMEGGLMAGEMAPAFTAQTLTGETVTHATYAGHSTTFVFISTHCKPCHELLPTLEKLSSGVQQSGGELVLVSGDDLEDTRALVKDMRIHLPVLVAPRASNSFFEDYKISSTPCYCHLNEQGIVQSSGYPGPQFPKWKALTESWAINKVYAPSERR